MPAATLVNPFPGLRPFEAHDDHHPFFGREEQVDDLLERLRRTRFLPVVGTSGSGKSSLVKAGLLPRLYGGFMAGAGSHWRIADFHPGLEPIANLVKRLAEPDALGESGRDPKVQALLLDATIRGGSGGLIEAVLESGVGEDENLLVVVDQFEEIFRFAKSAGNDDRGKKQEVANAAAAFVKLLLEAASDKDTSIYVVLTMRSDFIGECARFRGLPERINEGLFLVPRMTRDQLQRAIEQPVRVAGATIEPALVTRLLNDVGDDPDQLPVLQHALMRTWDEWADECCYDGPLRVWHYHRAGELKEALDTHANAVFGGLDSEDQATAIRLFKCLTVINPVSERDDEVVAGTRRPTRFADACAIIGAEPADLLRVIAAFNHPTCSFLMPPPGTQIDDPTMLDITHESLMRVWKHLEEWVLEEAQAAELYQRLASDAARKASLWRDENLAAAISWREKNPHLTEAWARRVERRNAS